MEDTILKLRKLLREYRVLYTVQHSSNPGKLAHEIILGFQTFLGSELQSVADIVPALSRLAERYNDYRGFFNAIKLVLGFDDELSTSEVLQFFKRYTASFGLTQPDAMGDVTKNE